MEQQRNLILAIAVSLAILLGFQYFFAPSPPPSPQSAATAGAPAAPGLGGGVAGGAAAPVRERAAILADVARVHIQSDQLRGSISLAGGRIDDLTLVKFRETVDPGSANIQLLHPAGFADAYYGEFGWIGDGKDLAMPSADTLWSADRATLAPDNPLTLSWDNGQGLRFVRRYALDRHYMITVSQRVENTGDKPVKLFPYALVSRSGTPHTEGFYILHEGVVGVMNGTLREHTYSDLKGEANIGETTRGGWLGITDKYWLVALVPGQQEEVKTRVIHSKTQDKDKYQVDYLGEERTLPPGGTAESVHRLFAGAKEVRVLRSYQDDLGIARFDYAVDWGWFFFLTKPIFLALDYIHHLIGNFGIAILLLTVAIKALFFPLANRSYVMMSKMKKLAPKLTELREKCGDDRVRLNQEMMAVYKTEKVNPLSGCLPIVLQIPVFFSLYKVLFVTIEMRHAPFYGWIHDLSSRDPTSLFNLFGLIAWNPPNLLMIGAWPLIMGVTMFLQQKLNPAPTDPMQAKIFMLMPIVFTVMLASFPAGLVIYWAWNNLLSIAQQWLIMRRMGAA